MSKYRVVVIDRPAWYLPILEQQELSRIDAEVLTGWSRLNRSTELGPAEKLLGHTVEDLSLFGSSWIPGPEHTEDILSQMAADADAIMVTTAKISGSAMDRMPLLRVIGRPGAGFDIVDVEAATARGIAVFNSPGFNSREVADHTMMLVLGCIKKLSALDKAMRMGSYERGMASGVPGVYELTLGIVGLGQIGREVAKRAAPFGFNILANDPYLSQDRADEVGATLVSLDDLLSRADVVSLHTPLSNETRHLLGAREFKMMKPTAYVINTSRGPVVDAKALIAALEAGEIAGAGLDVYEQEPLGKDSPLRGMENVILTPHVAGVSASSGMASKTRTARNIANALVGEWPETIDLVNPQVRERLKQVAPTTSR